MSEKDTTLANEALETGKAVAELAKTAGGEVIESFQDGSAAAFAKQKLSEIKDLVRGTTKDIERKDITVKSVTDSFNTESFAGVVSLASRAGMTLSVEAVKAVFNKSGSMQGIYDHFFSEEGPKEKSTEKFSIMSLLTDPGSAMEKISSMFNDLKSNATGWIDSLKNLGTGWGSQIAGFLESALGTLGSFLPSLGIGSGGENSGRGPVEVADNQPAENTPTQPSKSEGAGLDGAPRPTEEHNRVASNEAAPAPAPTGLAQDPKGPGGTLTG